MTDNTKFVVQHGEGFLAYFLRGTTWTGGIERAHRYDTEQAARDALTKARKFTKPAAFKAARIVPAPAESRFYVSRSTSRGVTIAHTVCDCVGGMVSQHDSFSVAEHGDEGAQALARAACDARNGGAK